MILDAFDRKILDALQADADQPIADIAERVGLSQTPCWRRIKRMEESGLIRKRVVLVDQKLANLSITVFLAIKAPRHEIEWLERFRKIVIDMPEIMEAYRLTGDSDYLLRIVVPSIEAYDEFYKRMVTKLEFSNMNSSIAMEEMKYTTALPTSYFRSKAD